MTVHRIRKSLLAVQNVLDNIASRQSQSLMRKLTELNYKMALLKISNNQSKLHGSKFSGIIQAVGSRTQYVKLASNKKL